MGEGKERDGGKKTGREGQGRGKVRKQRQYLSSDTLVPGMRALLLSFLFLFFFFPLRQPS